MSASPSETATLAIAAADEATEIFVIDAGLRRIATGRGSLEAKVPLGLYKIRFRSAASQHDELVEASSAGARVSVQGPSIPFHATAPIVETLTTHEYQSGPAYDTSRIVHANVGAGGELFVFVRDEDENLTFATPEVSLHTFDDVQLATLGAGDADVQGRWAALNVAIDPGTYCVRVDSGHMGHYEIFATVSPGWQTQIFLVMDEIWSGGASTRAPSLRSASILMSPHGRGFDPGDRNARLAELARQGLEQGRDVLSASLMNELLSGKFEAPMLGIMAAHLLLRRRNPNWELLNVVIDNLLNMLGEHPDMQALVIAAKDRAGPRIKTIALPPTLRQSWDQIVKASRRRATLVPPDSPAARIAAELVTAGPWLIHRLNKRDVASRADIPSLAKAARVVEQLVSMEPARLAEIVRQTTESGERTLSGLEHSVVSAAMSYTEGRLLKTRETTKTTSARTNARRVLGDISAPSYSIAGAVISLADKMKL